MKTCGNCVNCFKYKTKDGEDSWACDEYGIVHYGIPADCTPPNDEPCEFWTNDPKQKNKNYKAIMKLL